MHRTAIYLDTLIKTGSESIEATLRRRRILFAEYVARTEDETAEVRSVRRIGAGRGLRGGAGKLVDGAFPGRPRAFGINADQWTTAA